MPYTYGFNIFNSALKSLENILSLSSALRVCKCLCAEAVRRENQKLLNRFNGCYSVEISDLQTDAQVYPPITYLLDFLSNLIAPIGNEEHCPLHHFPLQTEKQL